MSLAFFSIIVWRLISTFYYKSPEELKLCTTRYLEKSCFNTRNGQFRQVDQGGMVDQSILTLTLSNLALHALCQTVAYKDNNTPFIHTKVESHKIGRCHYTTSQSDLFRFLVTSSSSALLFSFSSSSLSRPPSATTSAMSNHWNILDTGLS